MARLIFTGLFALTALLIAGGVELQGGDTPEWLIVVIAAAAGWMFGHVQTNGINGKKGHAP